MEKFGNDTFKYKGKLYRMVKNETGNRTCGEDRCPLYGELDGDCRKICSDVYYTQLKNPRFEFVDAMLVKVPESENKETNENNMKENEIDYKKLYEDEHDRYEEMCKAERMRLEQLASWYGALPDGNEKQFEKLEEIFPELRESEDERIWEELLNFHKAAANGEVEILPDIRHDIIITWLEKHKEQKPQPKQEWSEEDETMLRRIIQYTISLSEGCEVDLNDQINWLKSLKDRMTWRPTEEQMEALGDAVKLYKATHFAPYHVKIETLYEDLKKL